MSLFVSQLACITNVFVFRNSSNSGLVTVAFFCRSSFIINVTCSLALEIGSDVSSFSTLTSYSAEKTRRHLTASISRTIRLIFFITLSRKYECAYSTLCLSLSTFPPNKAKGVASRLSQSMIKPLNISDGSPISP